ncbi:hypothetical protein D3C76_1246060 [compost metagenome]
MLRCDQVDEHVLGRDHDDFAQREHQHRQAPGQYRARQRKTQQAGDEQAHAGQQPRHQALAADTPANQVLQGNDRHGVGGDQIADQPCRFGRVAGDHQVLGQVGGELAEHHRAQHPTHGKAHQPTIPRQPQRHLAEAGRRLVRRAGLQAAITQAPISQAHGQAKQGRGEERHMVVQFKHGHAQQRAGGVADVAEGVLDGEYLGPLIHRQ